MAAQVFWAVFYSSRWPSQIGPSADFDGDAIPPPIFSMYKSKQNWHLNFTTTYCGRQRQQLVKLDGMGLLIKASKVSRKNRFSNKLWLGLTPTHSKHLMMWSNPRLNLGLKLLVWTRCSFSDTFIMSAVISLWGGGGLLWPRCCRRPRPGIPTAHCPARPMVSPPLLLHTGLVLLIQLIITQTWARDWIRTHQKL